MTPRPRREKPEPRIVELRLSGERKPGPYGRLHISPDTAKLVRQLARHEKVSLDALVQRFLRVYLDRKKGVAIVYDDDGGRSDS